MLNVLVFAAAPFASVNVLLSKEMDLCKRNGGNIECDICLVNVFCCIPMESKAYIMFN